MTNKEKLVETTILALQGKLTEEPNSRTYRKEIIYKLKEDLRKILDEIITKNNNKLGSYIPFVFSDFIIIEFYTKDDSVANQNTANQILNQIKEPIYNLLQSYNKNDTFIKSKIDITKLEVEVKDENINHTFRASTNIPSLKPEKNVSNTTLTKALNKLSNIFYKDDLDDIENVINRCTDLKQFINECERISKTYGGSEVAFYYPWVEENLNAEGYTKQQRISIYTNLWNMYKYNKWDELKELANN